MGKVAAKLDLYRSIRSFSARTRLVKTVILSVVHDIYHLNPTYCQERGLGWAGPGLIIAERVSHPCGAPSLVSDVSLLIDWAYPAVTLTRVLQWRWAMARTRITTRSIPITLMRIRTTTRAPGELYSVGARTTSPETTCSSPSGRGDAGRFDSVELGESSFEPRRKRQKFHRSRTACFPVGSLRLRRPSRSQRC